MTSAARGPSTFPVEVTNVSPHGFWLFVDDEELFVPFTEFPWFKDDFIHPSEFKAVYMGESLTHLFGGFSTEAR